MFKKEFLLRLSHDALKEIACLDFLALIGERQAYELCVKWARHQLREMGNECPSDEEIRDKLGSVLYKIRFPTMTHKDFAELTAQSTVLTAEERLGVYDYITLGKKVENLKFVHKRRQTGEKVISRFKSVHDAWTCGGPTRDAIFIQATVGMCLTGVGLYGGTTASTHDVTVSVLTKDRKTLCTTVTKMTSDGRQEPIKVELENPVEINANTWYIVMVVIKGPDTWYGKGSSAYYNIPGSGKMSVYIDDNISDVYQGQIPQLFYYFY